MDPIVLVEQEYLRLQVKWSPIAPRLSYTTWDQVVRIPLQGRIDLPQLFRLATILESLAGIELTPRTLDLYLLLASVRLYHQLQRGPANQTLVVAQIGDGAATWFSRENLRAIIYGHDEVPYDEIMTASSGLTVDTLLGILTQRGENGQVWGIKLDTLQSELNVGLLSHDPRLAAYRLLDIEQWVRRDLREAVQVEAQSPAFQGLMSLWWAQFTGWLEVVLNFSVSRATREEFFVEGHRLHARIVQWMNWYSEPDELTLAPIIALYLHVCRLLKVAAVNIYEGERWYAQGMSLIEQMISTEAQCDWGQQHDPKTFASHVRYRATQYQQDVS